MDEVQPADQGPIREPGPDATNRSMGESGDMSDWHAKTVQRATVMSHPSAPAMHNTNPAPV
jgi:hypothetical protein